ncbi:hypothetical protein AHAS_Ahas13G0344200 [Arachis hypogaea]
MYGLCDNPFRHPINTPLFNPDMPYEFLLAWLHPDAPHHPFHDGPGHHHHPVQPKDHVVPELDLEKYVPEPIPERDLPLELIFSSSFGLSVEDQHTTSVSGPVCIDQSNYTSARIFYKIIEIFDDDNEEYPDVIEFSSSDDVMSGYFIRFLA